MSSRTRRRMGTAVATASAALAVAVGWLWCWSLFATVLLGYDAATTADGRCALREWTVVSSAGGIDLGTSLRVVNDPPNPDFVRALRSNLGFHAYGEEIDADNADRCRAFVSSLWQFAAYRVSDPGRWVTRMERGLVVPWAVPFVALLVPPTVAVVRRRRRLRREAAGRPVTSAV